MFLSRCTPAMQHNRPNLHTRRVCGMPNMRAILIITFYLDTPIACRILPRWWHSPSVRCRLICHVTRGWAGYIGMHRASSQRRRWFLHLCAFKLNAKRVLDGQRTKTIWLHTTPIESRTTTSGPEIRRECGIVLSILPDASVIRSLPIIGAVM